MTLLDILLEILDEWPKGVSHARPAQTRPSIYFYDKNNVYRFCIDYQHNLPLEHCIRQEEYEEACSYTPKATVHQCPICSGTYNSEAAARYCCPIESSTDYLCAICCSAHKSRRNALACYQDCSGSIDNSGLAVLHAATEVVEAMIKDGQLYTAPEGTLEHVRTRLRAGIKQHILRSY